MSATELDLPVLIASEQIRRREFVTTRRGYDPHQVRDYLEALADQVDLMASMIREARLETEAALRSEAEPRVDPYERLGERVASVIREADEAAERFRADGRRDAEQLMTEARAEAERIRTDASATAEDARRKAERALGDARAQADRTITGLSIRRDSLVDQLARMQERLLGVAHDLEATIVAPEMSAAPDPVAAPTPAPVEMPPSPDAAGGLAAWNRAAWRPPRIVDVRRGDHAPAAAAEAGSIDELFADLGDQGAGEIWSGTEAVQVEVPDIPPLDLDWGDGDRDEDDDEA